MTEKGLNFKTIDSLQKYLDAYNQSLKLITVPFDEKYIETSFGKSYVLCCGDKNTPPLVLLHAASCGSPIWYKNIPFWSKTHRVFAIDLIGESSKSILTKRLATPKDNAQWLKETIEGLGLNKVFLCGLSIVGWTSANFAGFYPQMVEKLILLSPVQTFAKMHPSYFLKIMKMGFNPTRQNVKNYIGWGNSMEAPLPDSIIEQFTISVMNINANACFPKWLKATELAKLTMPTLIMFGENEFAFSVAKAIRRAKKLLHHSKIEVVSRASHLLAVSKSDYINTRVQEFITAK